MVTPGQMATLFDPKRMQLVAGSRVAYAHRLKVGQPIEVQIENFTAVYWHDREIVPESAQQQSLQ
jgi:hypothetical protein